MHHYVKYITPLRFRPSQTSTCRLQSKEGSQEAQQTNARSNGNELVHGLGGVVGRRSRGGRVSAVGRVGGGGDLGLVHRRREGQVATGDGREDVDFGRARLVAGDLGGLGGQGGGARRRVVVLADAVVDALLVVPVLGGGALADGAGGDAVVGGVDLLRVRAGNGDALGLAVHVAGLACHRG